MHHRHRRDVFLLEDLRFPFRGCLIAERNKSITPFLRLGVIDSGMHAHCVTYNYQYMANKNLNAAKVAKKDEFYTQLADIERIATLLATFSRESGVMQLRRPLRK